MLVLFWWLFHNVCVYQNINLYILNCLPYLFVIYTLVKLGRWRENQTKPKRKITKFSLDYHFIYPNRIQIHQNTVARWYWSQCTAWTRHQMCKCLRNWCWKTCPCSWSWVLGNLDAQWEVDSGEHAHTTETGKWGSWECICYQCFRNLETAHNNQEAQFLYPATSLQHSLFTKLNIMPPERKPI